MGHRVGGGGEKRTGGFSKEEREERKSVMSRQEKGTRGHEEREGLDLVRVFLGTGGGGSRAILTKSVSITLCCSVGSLSLFLPGGQEHDLSQE